MFPVFLSKLLTLLRVFSPYLHSLGYLFLEPSSPLPLDKSVYELGLELLASELLKAVIVKAGDEYLIYSLREC